MLAPFMEVYMFLRKVSTCFLVLLLLSLSPSAFCQAVNATLLGTVTDSTGAAIGNAKVTATETSTGALHESVTNDSGNYTFPDLTPGRYTVTVQASGFKKE